MYVCMFLRTYVCNVCMYVCMCICMCVCIYASINARLYVCIFFKKRLVLLQKVGYSMYIILIVLKLFL